MQSFAIDKAKAWKEEMAGATPTYLKARWISEQFALCTKTSPLQINISDKGLLI